MKTKQMKTRKTIGMLLAVGLVLAAFGGLERAASGATGNYTYNGGDGNWTDDSKWSNATGYPDGVGAFIARSATSGDYIITLTEDVTVSGTWNAGGAGGLGGGTIQLKTTNNSRIIAQSVGGGEAYFRIAPKYGFNRTLSTSQIADWYLATDTFIDIRHSGDVREARLSSFSGPGHLKISRNNTSSTYPFFLLETSTHEGGTTVTGSSTRPILSATNAVGPGLLTINSGAYVDMRANQTVAGLAGDNANSRIFANGTRTLTLNFADTAGPYAYPGRVHSGGTLNLVKSGTGTQTLSGTNAYTGTTTINGGTLLVNGTHTGGGDYIVNALGTLGGFGSTTSTVSGAGLVSPGNSPGILTVGQVDPSQDLNFAFEFTAPGSPDYTNAGASINDVLRITHGTAPFTSPLGAGNTVDLYLNVTTLGMDTFRGGFYTDRGIDFLSDISAANFNVWVLGDGAGNAATFGGNDYYSFAQFLPGASLEMSTVFETANFNGGPVGGFVFQLAVVPEPSTYTLGLLGSLAVAVLVWRRRKGL